MLHQVIPSIYENLQELYQDCFKDTDEKTFHNIPVDTLELRIEFQELIKELIPHLLNMDDSRIISILDSMDKLCDDGLDLLGHGNRYTWTTGPWSVRLSTIDRIKHMLKLSLPFKLSIWHDKPYYEFYVPYGDDTAIVSCYDVTFSKYHVIFNLRPNSYTLNDKICNIVIWDDAVSYKSLNDGILPFFMTHYKKVG